MSVHFTTSAPGALLARFEAHVRDDPSTAWIRRDDAYTHASAEWNGKAFLRASVEVGQLTFTIHRPESTHRSSPTFAHYHAALVETFLLQFRDDFETAVVNGTFEPPDYAG
jgi:hypothetical protein